MNIQNLLKQAQQMQSNMGKVENELKKCEYQGAAGGNAVVAIATGELQIKAIEIEADLLEKDSKEMLQDMILLAVNAAMKAATADRDEKMGAITQGVKMPGVF